jgi:hypothetical protein
MEHVLKIGHVIKIFWNFARLKINFFFYSCLPSLKLKRGIIAGLKSYIRISYIICLYISLDLVSFNEMES